MYFFCFVFEQCLQCLGCYKVCYSSNEQDNIFIDVLLEKEFGQDVEGNFIEVYKVVILKECLDNFIVVEKVELICLVCGSKDGYIKQLLFKIFLEIFVFNVWKMIVVNWVLIKVDVLVIVFDDFFVFDLYLFKGY